MNAEQLPEAQLQASLNRWKLGLKGAPELAGQVGFFNLFVVKFDYQKEVLEIKEKS